MDIKELLASLDRILRYFIGGIFFYIAVKIINVNYINHYIKDLEGLFLRIPLMSVFFFFFFGTFFHILFRAICLNSVDDMHIKGSWIVFFLLDHNNYSQCTLKFVEKYSSPKDSRCVTNVYRQVRDECFGGGHRRTLHLQRSEIHFLYDAFLILYSLYLLKWVEFILASFINPFAVGIEQFLKLLCIFLCFYFFLIVGLILDMDTCYQERVYIRLREKSIIEFVKQFFNNKNLKRKHKITRPFLNK